VADINATAAAVMLSCLGLVSGIKAKHVATTTVYVRAYVQCILHRHNFLPQAIMRKG
jgi:hypothetical protein